MDMLPLPSADVEQTRILAAVNQKLFGHTPLHIGGYRVVRQLGAGGMGEVFLAHDEQLDREVAIKILDANVAAPNLLRGEARALARLSHPNVVQIHEFGQQDGRAHVVMEYVPGPTLRTWLDEHPRGRAEILAVVRAAGRGLAAAHRAGVVHRDFKPGNVIVGDDGRVRVLDFGLALASSHTQADGWAHAVAGTPRYMAPEQIRGARADARSDQFAFCVTLEEALWSRTSDGDALRSRRRPAWLWRCIRRGLEPDAAKRWPSMDALLDALDPRPRRRRLAAAGSVLGFALAVGAGTRLSDNSCRLPDTLLDGSWGPPQATELRAAFQAADAKLGLETADMLVVALDEWAASWRDVRAQTCELHRAGELGGALALRRDECLDDQRRTIEATIASLHDPDRKAVIHTRELVVNLPNPHDCEDKAKLRLQVADPPLQARAQIDRLRSQVDVAEANRAIGHAERNFELLERIREQVEVLSYAPLTAAFLVEQSATEYTAGSPANGRKLLELARSSAYAAWDDRLVASLLLEQSLHAVTEHLDLREADERLKLGREAWERVGTDTDARVELAYAAGAVAREHGELDVAERELKQALASLEQPDTRQHRRVFVLERLADVAEARGQLQEGLDWRVEAVSASEGLYGPQHPRTAQMRLHFAFALHRVRRDEDARTQLQRVLELWQTDIQPRPLDLAHARLLAANLALADHDYAAATVYAEQAIEIVLEQVPDNLETLANAHTVRAEAAAAEFEFEAALSSWKHVERSLAERLGETSRQAIYARIRVGVSLTDLRRFDEARAVLSDVLESTDANDEALLALTRTMLADLELRDARPSRAQAWLEPLTHGFAFGDPSSRLEFELLRGLASLRESGELSSQAQLAAALAAADVPALELIAIDLDKLGATTQERQVLGLSSDSLSHHPAAARESR